MALDMPPDVSTHGIGRNLRRAKLRAVDGLAKAEDKDVLAALTKVQPALGQVVFALRTDLPVAADVVPVEPHEAVA